MRSKRESRAVTRREFMASAALTSAALAVGCREHPGEFWEFLDHEQARTLAAICDQIIPADDFPGASQAGVLTYIDRQLMRHYRSHQKSYSRGLREADRISVLRCGHPLAEAPPQERVAIVAAIERENPQFFDLVLKHTMEGYYGSPRHGGNRDAVSWRMLGLSEPPLRGRAQYDLTKGKRT
jgi:gluconate 2-dehydrogenase gamma chain